MPVVGEFHRTYWRARANVPLPPGPASGWMYPQTQAAVLLSMSVWGAPFEALRPWWTRVKMVCREAWWLWRLSALDRHYVIQMAHLVAALDVERRLVLDRVVESTTGPYWEAARTQVRACATSPKFHQPEQWVGYSRAVKANAGHAQNVWRHVRVVLDLRAAHPITNPEAHLVTELAYQGLAAMGRPDRRVIAH